MSDLLFDRPTPDNGDMVFGAEAGVRGQTDLLFERAQSSSTDLIFGAGLPPVLVDFTLTGTLPDLTFAAVVSPVVNVTLVSTLPALTLVASVEYFSNAARPTVGQLHPVWQIAAHASQNAEQAHQDSPSSPVAWIARWQDAARTPANVEHLLPSRLDRSNRPSLVSSAQDATDLHSSALFKYQDAARNRLGLIGLFKDGTGARDTTLFKQQDGTRTHARRETNQQQATPRHLVRLPDHFQPATAFSRSWHAAFQDAVPPPAGQSFLPVVVPPPPPPCYLISTALLFESFPSADGHLVFRCDVGAPGGTPIDPTEPSVVVARKVYFIVNNLQLTRVLGGDPIEAFSVSVGIDRDSWAWSFSATIAYSDFDKIEPSALGPVEVELTINSVVWRFLVETYSRSETFGKTSVSVTGRSVTAFLGNPYALKRSYSQNQASLSRQAADDELARPELTGGFNLDWEFPDTLGWDMPQGTWSYSDLSPIDAIVELVQGAGGFVNSHPSLRTLLVRPEYKLPFWEWDSAVVDKVIPRALIRLQNLKWTEKPLYNGVYVSGVDTGVSAWVKKMGTAGDFLAPDYVNTMISADLAARLKGTAILSAGGKQAMVGLEMPMEYTLGALTPGMLIEVASAGIGPAVPSWRGQIYSTNIFADWGDTLTVSQTVEVERHYGGF